ALDLGLEAVLVLVDVEREDLLDGLAFDLFLERGYAVIIHRLHPMRRARAGSHAGRRPRRIPADTPRRRPWWTTIRGSNAWRIRPVRPKRPLPRARGSAPPSPTSRRTRTTPKARADPVPSSRPSS